MNHYTYTSTVRVPVAELTVDPDFDADKQYIRLHQQVSLGKIKVAVTRLPARLITSGYYDRRNNATVHITNLKQEYVSLIERGIRGGRRPVLDLYWSPLAPNGGGYVCSDDEVVLVDKI